MKELKFFKKTDIIVILIIATVGLAALAGYRLIAREKPAVAEIYYYSDLIASINLNEGEERAFSIPQKPNVILHQYPDGSICFEESDCPDKVCIHTGKISMVGQSAACLPNGIIVKIVPAGERDPDDPDIVVGWHDAAMDR